MINKILLFLFLVSSLYGADLCIRPGLTYNGDGSTWVAAAGAGQAGAFNEIPATLTRGDIYYLADGDYDPYSYNDDTSNTVRITLKKATVASHGTETGWDDAYGDGQAHIVGSQVGDQAFLLQSSYLTIDGTTGADTTNHGIKMSGKYCLNIWPSDTIKGLIVKHVEFEGAGWYTCVAGERAMNSGGGLINSQFNDNWFHDWSGSNFTLGGRVKDIVIEDNYFQRCGSGCAELHTIMIWIFGRSDTVNAVIRRNWFQDLSGVGGTGYITLGYTDVASSGYKIYNNIFMERSDSCGAGRLLGSNGSAVVTDVEFYHNTMYNLRGYASRILFYENTGNTAANNLWVECENTPTFNDGGIDTVNNSINVLDSTVFTDPDNNDFSLSGSIDIECQYYSDYGTDWAGVSRESGGVVDPGAYEYVTGQITRYKRMVWQ